MLYFEHVYRLHTMPKSIVNDMGNLFLSEFWQTIFKLSGTRLHISIGYHPLAILLVEVYDQSQS